MGRYVLMHGGFVGGWCWEKVVPLLEGAGHRVEAPDLPGSGDDNTPIPQVSLRGYAERICGVLDARPKPAVLVGQSSGGVAVSQATEQRPDKVEMLVYVGAFLLRDGETLLSASENDAESLVLANLVESEDGSPATLREEAVGGLLADCSDEDVERAKAWFEPQALAPLATPVSFTEDNYGRIPRVYIETLKDRAIGPRLQKEMYERVPCRKVVSMDTGHWPFYSAPEELAGHLTSLLRETARSDSSRRVETPMYPTLFACTSKALAEGRGFFGGRIFGGSKRHVRGHRSLSCPAAASPARMPPCG